MSFVGPRPEVKRYVDRYDLDQCRVFDLRPGITDAASIRYRHESELLEALENPEETYVRVIMPDKIRMNLEYAQRANVLSDCRIIVQTLASICFGNRAA
jgi:lipopolysaccharide/colanic/teichoic acid biosynthesis glycosyltransferase